MGTSFWFNSGSAFPVSFVVGRLGEEEGAEEGEEEEKDREESLRGTLCRFGPRRRRPPAPAPVV